MTKKELIRRSIRAKDAPNDTITAVLGLESFRDEFYFPPGLNWPQKEFDDRCTEIWIIEHCIRLIREHHTKTPLTVAEGLLFELLDLMHQTDNDEKEHIFRVASFTVEDILDYLNALGVS